MRILPGVNDLSTTHPDLIGEWDESELSPDAVSAGSNKKVWWRCRKGHRYRAYIYNRALSGTGCLVCTGRVPGTGNDLATRRPDLSGQWSDPVLRPEQVTLGSSRRVQWTCSEGHTWLAAVKKRVHGQGCPVCAGRTVLAGGNDLATTCPELVPDWHPSNTLLPTQVTAGSGRKVWWLCSRGHEWQASPNTRTSMGAGCPNCSVIISKQETELADFAESLVPVVRNTRSVIPPREIDIYCPDQKIGIEFNGVFWHTERFAGRARHLEKWRAAKAAGIQLIVVWEDDWTYRAPVVQQMIEHKLGKSRFPVVGARKTEVAEVSVADSRDFLERNHIQGWSGGSIRRGLWYRGELVACAVFRVRSAAEWELVRYATAARVPGGLGKLMRATLPAGVSCVTFADHQVSGGSLYASSGWEKETELNPDYRYLVGDTREHKFGFRLKRFATDPELKFEPGLTEAELAQLNGLERIWDYGKTRYRYVG